MIPIKKSTHASNQYICHRKIPYRVHYIRTLTDNGTFTYGPALYHSIRTRAIGRIYIVTSQLSIILLYETNQTTHNQ